MRLKWGWGVVLLLISTACSPAMDSRAPASFNDPETEMILPPGYNVFGPRAPNPADPFDQGPYGQAIGAYFKGQLALASQLPDEGIGFLKVGRLRNRGWGTYDLVEVLRYMGNALKSQYPLSERMQIADMSSMKGGQLALHNSHQNGLDADVAYLKHDLREADPYEDDPLEEKFVIKGRLSPNFDIERNWYLATVIYKTGRLNRIFVDWVIKDAFCAYLGKDGFTDEEEEILRRMQHVDAHDDHFHFRLTCPTRSSKCQDQLPPSPGHGCRSTKRRR